jgi:hypothetical protein
MTVDNEIQSPPPRTAKNRPREEKTNEPLKTKHTVMSEIVTAEVVLRRRSGHLQLGNIRFVLSSTLTGISVMKVK